MMDENRVRMDLSKTINIEQGGIPAFFKVRAVGYFMLGLFVLTCSIIWSVSTNWQMGHSIVMIAAVMLLLTTGAGVHMLLIAKAGKWFCLLLTCRGCEHVKLHQGIKNYLDPTSQTAFRQMQRVTFTAQDGTVLTFDFDLHRHFLPNAEYVFYFRRPDGEITVDMLEKLKIDHQIHPKPAPVK